jgi:hypothetical protein
MKCDELLPFCRREIAAARVALYLVGSHLGIPSTAFQSPPHPSAFHRRLAAATTLPPQVQHFKSIFNCN